MRRPSRFAHRPIKSTAALSSCLAIVGGLLLTGCGGGGSGDKPTPTPTSTSSPATDPTPTTKPAATPTTKPIPTQPGNTPAPTGPATLSAQGLAEKFRTHSGKAVTVEGVVETAVEVSTGTNVVLGTAPGFPKVRLRFPKGRWTGDKPAPGDAVTAKGTVTKAVTAVTFVDVSDCELVKRTPGKPDEGIAVTAEGVTAEFEKDTKVAEAKYKDKTLRVTGTVLRVSDAGKTAGAVVFLKGATPTDKRKDSLQVSAVFTKEEKDEVLKLKAGDTVTFTGKVLSFKVAIANNDWTLQLVQPKLVK